MKSEITNLLLHLNQDFYDTYAKSFSSTRYTIQPGIRRLLPQLLKAENILDLGCGNGNLAQSLLDAGFSNNYLGMDNSKSLLTHAINNIPENERVRFTFQQSDLAVEVDEPADMLCFDTIVSFAVLHHFPADYFLNRFFEYATRSLTPNGKLFISCWQVKNNQRLKSRLQPWSVLGIDQEELDEGDLLLDWRAEPSQPARYRYVHHYDSETLTMTGNKAGLKLSEEYYSDGKEGDLALYQVWNKPLG